MTDKQIEEFERRIATGGKEELLIVTFDIMSEYIEEAESDFQKKNIEEFLENTKKARNCLGNLISGLNMDYNLSHELLRLYLFINKSLIQSEIRKEPLNYQCINTIINKIRNSFAIVAANEKRAAGYNNDGEIYAGLTYSKGASLNETVFGQKI